MAPKKGICFLVLCMTLIYTNLSFAAFIELGESGWAVVLSPAMEEVVSVSLLPFNIEDAVVIEIDKEFKQLPDEMGIFSPIVIEFQKLSEDAVSNIIISDEYIVNNTGVEWFDFHMLLIVGDQQAGFNPNYIPSGDQFEDVSYGMYYGYDDMPIGLDFMDIDGHGVLPSPAGDDVFWPGQAEGKILIEINPAMDVGQRFRLKEFPTVPEPVTLILFGMGALLTLTHRRRSA